VRRVVDARGLVHAEGPLTHAGREPSPGDR
jgi:hypothetical protein